MRMRSRIVHECSHPSVAIRELEDWMMIDFEINDKGTLVWNDGSSRPATHQEQELTYELVS